MVATRIERQNQANEDKRERRRRWAAVLAVGGLALLLGVAFLWAWRQSDRDPAVAPAAPVVTTTPTATTAAPPAESSTVSIDWDGNLIWLQGNVKTESERDALVTAATDAGLVVDDQLTVSAAIDDSDPRVVASLLAPLLDGTTDGELALVDGTVTIVGEALDPVEADEIQAAVDTAKAAGLLVEDKTTVRVLPEDVQIAALQREIDQIFELARKLEGQYPNFETSDEDLGPGAKETLDRVAVAFRRYPLPVADVVGHTDSIGSDESNVALSKERAQVVTDYLVNAGVDSDRLVTVGRGESEPVADNSTDAGQAENRRVDFVVKKRET